MERDDFLHDRPLTALENLELKNGLEVLDLVYQGQDFEQVVRKLYCKCRAEYPGAEAFDSKH